MDSARLDRRGFLVAAAAMGASTLWLSGCSKKAGAALPGRVTGLDIPSPTSALVSRWDADPWARGSYSALPVGTEASVRAVLASSVIGGRVFLAGEYLATDYPATVTGAYLSGIRAARRVARIVPRRSRVLVVGAGIAGLATASELNRLGRNPLVLEARDRIGGRVYTSRAWGVPVELGASWVEGVDGNPVGRLALQSGCGLVPTNWDDGEVHNVSTGAAAPTIDAVTSRLSRIVDAIEESDQPPDRSAAQALALRGWRNASVAERFAVETGIVQDYGVDIGRLGAQALTEGSDGFGGGDAMVSGGYQGVAQLLGRGIPIRLSSPVRSVAAGRARVLATQFGGRQFGGAAAIVAVPLALLQRDSPKITALPPSVRRAANSLMTGNLEKVVLEFNSRWWPNSQILGALGAPGQRWSEWLDLTDVIGRPALMGFSGGSAARRRPSSNSACVAEAMAVLRGAFG